VFVELSGRVASTSPDTLPADLSDVVRTRGRSIIEAGANRIEPVARITVNTVRFDVIPRHGAYEPGDRVYVRDNEGRWSPARVIDTPASVHDAGAPPVVLMVELPGVENSPTPRDAVVVRREGDNEIEAYPFARVRPLPPDRD
jgi:hypothetical protein